MSAPPRTPADYSAILAGADLPIIVGGQAVNLWAGIYASQAPALETYAPFISKDADIYGTRTLAATLAARSGWVCHFTDDPASVAVAILVKPAKGNEPALTIEVLNEVNGLTEADLAMNTIIELAGGARYRTPSPIVLLKAKLYNLVSLANLDRPQDIRHVRILMQIVPLYLNELWSEFRAKRSSEDELLAAVRYAGSVVLAPFAGNAARSHNLNLEEIFPLNLQKDGPQTVRLSIEEIRRQVSVPLEKKPAVHPPEKPSSIHCP